MRELIKQFTEIIAEFLPIAEPIYEFGSLRVTGQEELANLRPLFPGKKYIGCDMREGKGVDKVLNLHDIDLPSETVGTVLAFDTLEHVEYPRRAIEEIHRILKLKGMIVISSVMNFYIHDTPYDYWRFTPEAFKSLLRPFTQSYVDFAGNELHPHTIVGVGFKETEVSLDQFIKRCLLWKKQWYNMDGKSIKAVIKTLAPPILLDMYRKYNARISAEN